MSIFALSIGQRNDFARIERLVLTPDGQGGHTQAWTLRATVWVNVEPLSSREALMAGQLAGVLQSALTMPFRSDLSITDRIVIGSRVMQVTSYQDPSGLRRELRVLVSEVQA